MDDGGIQYFQQAGQLQQYSASRTICACGYMDLNLCVNCPSCSAGSGVHIQRRQNISSPEMAALLRFGAEPEDF